MSFLSSIFGHPKVLPALRTFTCIKDNIGWLSICGNNLQTRSIHVRKRRRTHAPFYWNKRKPAYKVQDITPSNQKFIQEVIQEKFAPSVTESILKESPWPKGEWTERSMRTGLIAKKIGIYPMWQKDGKRIFATLLQVLDNHVISYIPPEIYVTRESGKRFKGRFGCLVVGADAADPQIFTKQYNSMFTNSGVMPKRKLTRFIVTKNAAIQPGTPLSVSHFRVGDYVDIYGKTVGHGFQGVVKRWGMKGGPATHGTTKAHRRVGSIGTGRLTYYLRDLENSYWDTSLLQACLDNIAG